MNARWMLAALGLITFLGLGLRLTNVFESLWLDELHTGWVVKEGWQEIAWRAQIGNQSPLWFYAVKLITTLGGVNELTLRLLSLVAGTALIPAAYWLVLVFSARNANEKKSPRWRVGLEKVAPLFAAALVAIDPNCIFYATEARPYACLQLAAAVHLGLLWQLLQRPTTGLRIGWILLAALMFHLHYTGALVLIGQAAVLLGYYAFSRERVAYRPWRAMFDGQVAIMLCLPALPHVLEVANRRSMWKLMSERPELADLWWMFPLEGLTAVGIVVGLAALVQRVSSRGAAKLQMPWAAVGLLLVWFVLPLLAAFFASRLDVARLFVPRYVIAAAIGPMLLAGLLLSQLPRRSWQVLTAAGVIGFALYDGQIVEQLRYDGRAVGERQEDWRGAIAWLREQRSQRPGPVEVYGGLIEEYALTAGWLEATPYREDQWAKYLRFPLDSCYELPAVEAASETKWIVHRGELDRGIPCILSPHDLATKNRELIQLRSFGQVHVSEWGPERSADAATSP